MSEDERRKMYYEVEEWGIIKEDGKKGNKRYLEKKRNEGDRKDENKLRTSPKETNLRLIRNVQNMRKDRGH